MIENILSDLIINRITGINTMYSEKNESNRRKSRPQWSITFKYEGETEYLCNGKKIVSNIYNPVILPKGVNYEWRCTKPGHFCAIEFECDHKYEDILPFNISSPEKLMKIYKKLEYIQINKATSYKLDLMKYTYEAISFLLNCSTKNYIPSKKHDKLKPAIDYISSNYMHNIKNDDLAKICSLSTSHFRNLFKEITDSSPVSYIHTIRINKAKEMLKGDYKNISYIALSLGYSSIYEFSKTFKKHVGVSPTQYTKSYVHI